MSRAIQPGRPLAERRALERFLGGRTSAWRGCDDGTVDTCTTHSAHALCPRPVLVTAACAARARAALADGAHISPPRDRVCRFVRTLRRALSPRFARAFRRAAPPRIGGDFRQRRTSAPARGSAEGETRRRGRNARGRTCARARERGRAERTGAAAARAKRVRSDGDRGRPPRGRATATHLQPKPTPLIKRKCFPWVYVTTSSRIRRRPRARARRAPMAGEGAPRVIRCDARALREEGLGLDVLTVEKALRFSHECA